MLVGNTDGAFTAIEKSYTATIMLCGTILTAYMVSQLSVFLSQVHRLRYAGYAGYANSQRGFPLMGGAAGHPGEPL
jgi:hypothetical protein